MRTLLLFFLLAGSCLAGAYRIDTIPLPPEMDPEISGISFTAGGTLVAINRRGQVWMRDREDRWRLFAQGLHEPLGLHAESESVVYVMQRPELTRLVDSDGDGRADRFETIFDGFGITDNYHEFSYGLPRDKEGNFVAGLGSVSGGSIERVRGLFDETTVWEGGPAGHRSVVPYRGWIFKISPSGEFIPWASGFRQAVGVGVSPDGEIFVADSQGQFIPASPLNHVRQGGFYGSPDSLKWSADFQGRQLTEDELWERRSAPAIVFPHGVMGGSPGQPAWDTTGGRFGPFENQVFVGDITQLVSRVSLEKVSGEYQGSVVPFLRGVGGRTPSLSSHEGLAWAEVFRAQSEADVAGTGDPLEQGSMRLEFSPDGHLYVGRTVRGWAPGEGGLQRIVWTGEVPVEIHSVQIQAEGFRVNFTQPMEQRLLADSSNYQVRLFRYAYHNVYGSPEIDQAPVAIQSIAVSEDRRRVDLEIRDLRPGFIYEFSLDALRSTEGRPIENPLAFYTVNRLVSGEAYTGPRPQPPPDVVPLRAYRPNAANGEKVYATFCIACHQPDGRGFPGGAASFADPNGSLSKDDAALLAVIIEGSEAKGMPGFRGVLTDRERRDVLAYIRSAFGGRGP